jgi:hypothetical protein
VLSVPRCYKENKLRQSPATKDVSAEDEVSTALEAVTIQRLRRLSTCRSELLSM